MFYKFFFESRYNANRELLKDSMYDLYFWAIAAYLILITVGSVLSTLEYSKWMIYMVIISATMLFITVALMYIEILSQYSYSIWSHILEYSVYILVAILLFAGLVNIAMSFGY